MTNSDGSGEEQGTRPISVAELLARNGTIGSPPVGGRRRRRRARGATASLTELTGEIPVVTDDVAEPAADEVDGQTAEEFAAEEAQAAEEYADSGSAEMVVIYEAADQAPDEAEEPGAPVAASPAPLAVDPLPHRSRGPLLSHDPRPARRGLDAEQMSYDPVLEAVDLGGLVEAQATERPEQRAYLQSPGGPLFGGQTVADDLARGGSTEGSTGDVGGAWPSASGPGRLRAAVVAIAQSVLAVAFGAGLFIGFDQLWRWNTIVALVLSVLVILGLVVAVRIVRRTEDIASTLIAVAVGALVTLGPLALLQSYG